MALSRRALVAAIAASATLPRALVSSSAAQAAAASASMDFGDFLESLWPVASGQNVSRTTFDRAIAGLTPDPLLMAPVRQAEFERTISAYLDDAVTSARIGRGREAQQRWRSELATISARSGVPAEIIVALWGMESDFGRSLGDRDVVRSVATLAYAREETTFQDEFVAALLMLEEGDATRARLRGSWAGAMGHPQFMPSAYLKYARAYAGDGPADIWTSIPDALASIGNFLAEQDWKRGRSWGAEVAIPAGFTWASLTGSTRAFEAQGLRTIAGAPLPLANEATLFLPAGARGPAFLLAENYWVIKQYNNSDSYAVAVTLLAEQIAGRPGVVTPWPKDLRLLARADRVKLQTLLQQRGYYDGKVDGRFGPATRASVHNFQHDAGMQPADGFPSAAVLARLARDP